MDTPQFKREEFCTQHAMNTSHGKKTFITGHIFAKTLNLHDPHNIDSQLLHGIWVQNQKPTWPIACNGFFHLPRKACL
jgi:hypothetical protein